jgi:sigma-54 dependent transcriptional regulator, acetoin dehydrogenase operon transcriptional activator AcoR
VSDTETIEPVRSAGGRTKVAAIFVVLDAAVPAPGTRHLLRGVDRVVIGRGSVAASQRSGSSLRIELADPRVSTEHAVIERALGDWVLRDLDSKNGVAVARTKITQRPLADGDWIEIGHTLLRFRTLEVGDDAAVDLTGDSGRSLVPGVEHATQRLGDAAPSAVPILLLGESGVGKELAARMIHERSGRTGPFVAINCAGIVESLVGSTLFGHRRGAFTGAVDDQPGAFRAATSGTLLLDEVADLPAATQGALLRVLQEREVVPVGETRPIAVDVRVIAATLRDLDREVEAGRFRIDLLARLAGLRITLPPLRERLEDLGTLIAISLGKHAPGRELGFAQDAATALCHARWPLNIRALDQAIAAAAAVTRGKRIELVHLPEALAATAPSPDPDKRDELIAALQQHHGNIAAIARELATSRAQIHRLLERYQIDPETYR